MVASILQKIPLAVVGIVLVLAVATIYFRSKNVTRSEFFKIFKSTRLISAWILIFVIGLSGIFGIFNHMKAKHSVNAIVALNYSEASQAQNSNGTRYNMAEIICDEVLKKAIEKGAFEKVTAKQLKDCLSVYPYVQGDVDDKANYHISTEFAVEYHASKHTDHLDAANVIALIASAYKDYYIEKYTDNFSPTSEDEKPDYSKMEYMDIVSYFEKETTTILNYLYGMAGKGTSFVTSNNTTFNSIAGKVYQFKETQIEQNLKALILQHGIVRDKENYIGRLTYYNTKSDFERQKNAASYNLRNQAVAMYAEEMTRVVLVPTWDEGGKYYMGRTKVGIDELSVEATEYSDQVAAKEKEIMDNNLAIEKMQTVPQNDEMQCQADELIETIDKSIDGFKREAIKAGREYSNYTMNQCIAVSIYGSSLFSELKTIVLFAFLAYIAALLYAASRKFPKA